MTTLFERAAILGLGLMGASLGLALRAAGCVGTIVGYDAALGVAERARELGAIDDPCGSASEAVAGADLVVLATPVIAMRALLAEIAPHLAPGAVVTDLGSTKAEVTAWTTAALPANVHFVGGHPMTGRERSGMGAADAALYAGCVWCLTPTPQTPQIVLERAITLVAALGARPVSITPEQHDAAVATISHLPLLVATAVVLAASGDAQWDVAAQLAAGGFRDTTRVASGDPRMARDICLTNAQPLLATLDACMAQLQALRVQIAAHDPAIEDTFARAKQARDAWLAARIAPS